jgi:phage gp45-like
MYFGIVKNNVDPEKLGRVKVSIFGCHEAIETKDLGWSQVMMPGDTPAISGQGHSVNLVQEVLWEEGDDLPDGIIVGDVKVVGSLVCGMFLDDFQQEFMVMGTLPTKTAGAFDNNDRVRSINPHVDDPKGDYEPDSTFAPVYPYNNVYETGSGHAKEYDDTPGYERIMERHKSGTQYEIQSDGTKIERVVRDNYQLVVGHDTLEVYGNVRIIVSGQADIAVANDTNIAVGGNLTADVTGNMTANITGTTSLIGVDNIKIDVTGSGKKITLDGDVDITGDLRLTAEGITLNTHTHGQNNVDQPNTAEPNTN